MWFCWFHFFVRCINFHVLDAVSLQWLQLNCHTRPVSPSVTFAQPQPQPQLRLRLCLLSFVALALFSAHNQINNIHKIEANDCESAEIRFRRLSMSACDSGGCLREFLKHQIAFHWLFIKCVPWKTDRKCQPMPEFIREGTKTHTEQSKAQAKDAKKRKRARVAHNQMVVKINQCYRTADKTATINSERNNGESETTKYARREKLLSAKIPIIIMMHRCHFSSPTSRRRFICAHIHVHVCMSFVATSQPHINIQRSRIPTIDLSHASCPIMYF